MADAKGKTVSVTALTAHTNAGKTYQEGDTYSVPESEVDNLVTLGMAQSTADAKQDAKDAKAAEKAAEKAERDAEKDDA